MFDSETLRGFISLGGFVGIGGFILIFLQPPGSAEQILSICSALMGAGLIGAVILVTRLRRGRG
ncbi:MAG: hypothetical protein KME04_15675 [Pleurocapsa minor GSE-CHR-MK-17-07R]|nr:hypothetical protein [Pleurocapsa minor GSE-CHR-MK 17-07R]